MARNNKYAIQFNGTVSSKVNFNNHAVFKPTQITSMAWVKINNLPYAAGCRWLLLSDTYELGLNWSGGNPNFFFNTKKSSSEWNNAPFLVVSNPFNKWYHVAGTFDGSKLKLYLNGVKVAETNASPIYYSTNSNRAFPIAGLLTSTSATSNLSSDWLYSGQIDNPSIWSRALSDEEIAYYYNKKLYGDELGLLFYLPFEEGVGTTIKDIGPSKLTAASVTNITWVPAEVDLSVYAPSSESIKSVSLDFTSDQMVGDKATISWDTSLCPKAQYYRIEYFQNNEWNLVTVGDLTNSTPQVFFSFDAPNSAAKFRVRAEYGEDKDGNPVVSPWKESRTFKVYPFVDSQPVRVGINAYSKMLGDLSIVGPPKRVIKSTVIKDSTVRENLPIINYGHSPQMMVDRNASQQEMHSFLGFQIDWPEDIDEILVARLVLYKQYTTNEEISIDIFNSDFNWLEPYITWSYQPPVYDYIQSFIAPKGRGDISVNMIDYVRDVWIQEGSTKSFTLKLPSGVQDSVAFSTKEGSRPPYFELIYYEKPKMVNSYSLPAEIIIKKNEEKLLPVSLNLLSNFIHKHLDASFNIPRHNEFNEIDGEIIVRYSLAADIEGEIWMKPKHRSNDIDGEIIIPYTNDLNTSFTIKNKHEFDDLDGEIICRAPAKRDLVTKFKLLKHNTEIDIDAELTVKKITGETIDISFNIPGHNIDEDLNSEITVSHRAISNINADFEIKDKDDFDDIDGEIYGRAYVEENIDSTFKILKKGRLNQIDGEIYTRGFEPKFFSAAFNVKKVDDLNQIEGELTARRADYGEITTSLTIRSKDAENDIDAEVEIIEKLGISDLDAEIIPRVPGAALLPAEIQIGDGTTIKVTMNVVAAGGAYAYIM